MKKIFLIIGALSITLTGIAQEKYVTGAKMALDKNNLEEAKEDIDKAMMNPESQEKPKALFVKGKLYTMLQNDDKYKSSNPYREAAAALIKLVAVKSDYEKDEVNRYLIYCASCYFNDGVRKYASKDDSNRYQDVAELFKNVIKIRDLEGGKRFEGFGQIKSADSIVAKANMFIALCSYNMHRYDEAIPLLTNAKNNPVTKTVYVYEDLIDAYERQKNMDQEIATIQEARTIFPNDEGLRNDELNYYMITGKQDMLVKKLEDEAAKDPKNGELQFSIAIVCTGLANPKTGNKPANSAELLAKAEDAFQKALAISPDNAEYNYNIGGFYNNEAKEVNDQMNDITGTSDADTKKYNALKAKRDALFEKALPYIEKAYNTFDAKAATLSATERTAYNGALRVLIQIYSIQNKMDKVEPLKKKLNAK